MWAWLEKLTGRQRRRDPSPNVALTPMAEKIRMEQRRSEIMKRLAAIDIQIQAMRREQDEGGGSTAA